MEQIYIPVTEAEALRGMIHIGYEDLKVRKVSSTSLIKKRTTYLGEEKTLALMWHAWIEEAEKLI